MHPQFMPFVQEIEEQAKGFVMKFEPVSLAKSPLKGEIGEINLSDDGVKLTYEGFVYEIYLWLDNNQAIMFSKGQKPLTIMGDPRMTVQMMMAEIKARVARKS